MAKNTDNSKWTDYFKTEIANTSPGHVWVRGYPIEDLMGHYHYAELVALVLKGELPDEGEAVLMDAILGSILSHGFDDTSEPVARFTASGNPDPIAACAAGILSIGAYQGGATRTAVEFIAGVFERFGQSDDGEAFENIASEVASECIQAKYRIPGFGHPVHKEFDPRARRLFALAEEHKVIGPYTKMYLAIHKAFNEQRGKQIVINADGAAGVLMADMGYDPLHMEVIVAISFLPGILASAVEEIKYGRPFRVLPSIIAKYTGPEPRDVPSKG